MCVVVARPSGWPTPALSVEEKLDVQWGLASHSLDGSGTDLWIPALAMAAYKSKALSCYIFHY